jgi:FKBP-type peptidyl-prolyl cis-trans isomerase 2
MQGIFLMTKKYYFILASVILLVLIMMTGCSGPAQAKTGDTVKVRYTGKLADGTVFDSSVGSEPYEFTLGQGQTISGFEQAVIGMKVGETKTVTIPVDEAYGPRRDDLIVEIGRDRLSQDINPEVGMQLTSGQGTVTIIEVSETTVKIDANHPLAGQDLTFDIELVEIGGSQPQGASLTAITLKEALTNGKPTLAEFGRGTCIPCKQMKPILEELAMQYKDRLNVSIVSVDEYRDLTNYHKVMAIPTQIGFDSSGKEIFRHVGFWAKEDIIAKLTEIGIE